MKDELDQLLRNLHLRHVAELFEEEVKRAEKQKLSYEELCCRLLRAQWQRNQETALAYRIKPVGVCAAPEEQAMARRVRAAQTAG